MSPLLDALGPLLELPGVFVFGSNDYYGPTCKNPLRYLPGTRASRRLRTRLPTDDLVTGHADVPRRLDRPQQRRDRLKADDREIELVGAGRPPHHASTATPTSRPRPWRRLADRRVHAPYLRVLDAMTADGYPLILAGHTHGGQVCMPFYGALVTNCDLDTGRVKGLSAPPVGGPSAPTCTSRRAAARRRRTGALRLPPEATLLTLTPRGALGLTRGPPGASLVPPGTDSGPGAGGLK